MPKQEVPFSKLQDYLPENCFEDVYPYLQAYKVQLTITRQRQSILGDFRNAHSGKAHRISVNGNLNKYNFLITLLHELAHLFTYERFGHRVNAHGAEWKKEFQLILSKFIAKELFPEDIRNALIKTIKNPPASSCGDENLLRILRKYDVVQSGQTLVEALEEGTLFEIKGGRVFKKGNKIRKRHQCIEMATGKLYLFSGLYEAKTIC